MGREEVKEVPYNLTMVYLLSAGYDGKKEKAFLKLYDSEFQKVFLWYDNTGHLPYCISKTPIKELKGNRRLLKYPGFIRLEEEKRLDTLNDEKIVVTKVIASNPLAIGGGRGGIRNLLDEAWESKIIYYQNYIFDNQLIPGMPYRVKKGNIEPLEYKLPYEIAIQIKNLYAVVNSISYINVIIINNKWYSSNIIFYSPPLI